MQLTKSTQQRCDANNALDGKHTNHYAVLPRKMSTGEVIWLQPYYRVYISGKYGTQLEVYEYAELPEAYKDSTCLN